MRRKVWRLGTLLATLLVALLGRAVLVADVPAAGSRPAPCPPALELPSTLATLPNREDVAALPVDVFVFPFVPTNLGDRVIEPATVFVHAPGATRVDVYLWPVDAPFGGKHLDRPKLIGSDGGPCHVETRPAAAGAPLSVLPWAADEPFFAVPWAADEPYLYVEIFAVAYGQPGIQDPSASRSVDILLDWRGTSVASSYLSRQTPGPIEPSHAPESPED